MRVLPARSAGETGWKSDMLSNGNGAFNWNSKMSGRQETCGIDRDAVRLQRGRLRSRTHAVAVGAEHAAEQRRPA